MNSIGESSISVRRALGDFYYEKQTVIIEHFIAILRTGFFLNFMLVPQKLCSTTMIQIGQYLPTGKNCSSLLVLEGRKSME